MFYGITCNSSYVKPKSCINLSRQCEFGVALDQSIELLGSIRNANEQDEDISYVPVAVLEFDRITNSAIYDIDVYYKSNNDIVDLCNDVINRYNEWSVYHTKDTIRNTILRIINDTHPVALTPTGLCLSLIHI